jgi:hypothetical protein
MNSFKTDSTKIEGNIGYANEKYSIEEVIKLKCWK